MHHVEISVSDVDRAVYETLDLRVAQHPSETMHRMLVRTFAYCLSYEEGIAFSKGGLSSNDEPPIAVWDPTGLLLAWIEVGAPSCERLHKASKAARRVAIYTTAGLAELQREARKKAIYRVEEIDVWRFAPAFIDAIEPSIRRHTRLEVTRSDGRLYVAVDGAHFESAVERSSLLAD